LYSDNTKIVVGSRKIIREWNPYREIRYGIVELWDLEKSEVRKFNGHEDSVLSVALFTDNTKIISGSKDRNIKLWDIETGDCLRTFIGHTKSVLSVVVFSDNTKILSASKDHTIKIWEVETGVCLRTLLGHKHWVCCLSLFRNNTRLVSSSSDKTINNMS